MSLHIRTRRLVSVASSTTSTSTSLALLLQSSQRRSLWGFGKQKGDDISTAPKNLLTEEFLKKKPANRPSMTRGDLAESSIFEDEDLAGPKPQGTNRILRNPNTMAAALDPQPGNRKRWERKMVIKEIHRRGRLSPTEIVKRQERELMSKSHNIKTSVKKLGPLAQQIAGKTVEEAIIQMRFSKKKAAQSVREHLEHARNEAIVRRGMGLGQKEGEKFHPVKIQAKDGKKVIVRDPTTIYVDQAWVGKSDFGMTPDHRARGAIYMMKNPTTHIQVILKEEATRIRLNNEREEKIRRKPLWVQLPNRKITAQRQYYSW